MGTERNELNVVNDISKMMCQRSLSKEEKILSGKVRLYKISLPKCDIAKIVELIEFVVERNERKVNDIEKMIYVSKVCQKEKILSGKVGYKFLYLIEFVVVVCVIF